MDLLNVFQNLGSFASGISFFFALILLRMGLIIFFRTLLKPEPRLFLVTKGGGGGGGSDSDGA